MKAQEKAQVILGFRCYRATDLLTKGLCNWVSLGIPEVPSFMKCMLSLPEYESEGFCLEELDTIKKNTHTRNYWPLNSGEANITSYSSQIPNATISKALRKTSN